MNMNVKKVLPLFVIASMMVALIPSALVGAAVTNTLSVSVGPVGTKTVVSGTITTYNGRLKIEIDADNDGAYAGVGEVLAGVATTLTADGYAYAKEITIPDAYAGARRIHVTDLDAAGTPTADSFFTVQTTYALKTDESSYFEGGGVGAAPITGVTFTATIKGAPIAWAAGIDLQYRIKKPDGTYHSTPGTTIGATEGNPGNYIDATVIFLPQDAELSAHGTYTAYLDYDETGTATWKTGKATTTFVVRTTDQTEYERTLNAYMEHLVPAGKTLDKIEVIDSTGANVAVGLGGPLGVGTGTWLGPTLLLTTAKDSTLGSYTVKLYDIGGSVYKTQSFSVKKAAIDFTVALFQDQSARTGVVGPIGIGTTVERMHTAEAYFVLQYPDMITVLTSADLPSGFTVKVTYNGTVVDTLSLNPLTAYNPVTFEWKAAWKVPKDAKKGINYEFNVTAASTTDAYGNTGPADTYSTRTLAPTDDNFFEVIEGTLYCTSGPTLSYPSAGANFPVTSTAKALVEVKYADNTRFTGAELKWFNFTVDDGTVPNTYDFNAAAADYSADVGLWVLKGKIPYDATLSLGYVFTIDAGAIEDTWGNGGNAGPVATAGTFTLIAATINISELAVNAASYESDEQLTVTFKATYAPSGDVVTTRDVAPFPRVTIYDSGDTAIATVRAGYNSGSQKWTASWIIPAGVLSGTYNATVNVNDFVDETTTNTGPTAKKYTNFDVSRVSMTDVLAASNAAKAAADLASTKADAAKVAADTASTKADAAKVAADAATVAANAAKTAADGAKTAATSAQTTAQSAVTAATDAKTAATDAKTAATDAKTAAIAAGTKADAATAAANAAKASADAAKAATDSLTTMVYVAIAASVVAALAAIFAVMQITKKIA